MTLVGLATVITRNVQLPREWTTVAVGVALLAAGLIRRALRGPDGA